MIRFVIHLFRTVTGIGRYVGLHRPIGSLSLDELIDYMMERDPIGGRAAAQAVLTNFFAVCQDRLLEGYNLTTPLFNTTLAVKGEFDGPTDSFRPGRNTIHFRATAGTALQKALEAARVEKLESIHRVGNATQLVDVLTGAVSTTLSRGGLARLTGKRLRIGAGADEGLFVLLPSGAAIAVTQVAANKPSELIFQIPAAGLTPGEQVQLELRNRLNSTPELRIVRLLEPLTVA